MDQNKWRVAKGRTGMGMWLIFAPGSVVAVVGVRRTHGEAIDALPALMAAENRRRLGMTAP